MAASGARVLQLRSVEYARNHGVRIHCRSSFEQGTGTLVVAEDETLENPFVTAVTHSAEEARVTLAGVRNEPGMAGRIFTALADANVNVDVIIQNEPVSTEHGADLSFTVSRDDLDTAVAAIEGENGMSSGEILTDDPDRQGLDHRRRHAQPPGRRRQGLQGARRRGHQHRDDLDVADQDLLRDRRRPGRRCRPRAARRLRARRRRDPRRGLDRRAQGSRRRADERRRRGRLPGRRARRHRSGRLDRPRGARRALVPGRRARPARLGPLGGAEAAVRRRRGRVSASSPTSRSPASTSSSPRPVARSAPSGRRGSSPPAPSSSTTPASGGCTRRCRSSSARSTPRPPTPIAASSPTRTARRCRWSSR